MERIPNGGREHFEEVSVAGMEYAGRPVQVGDYQFQLRRDRSGHVIADRQPLKGECPDPAQPRERLSRVELPTDALQKQFDVLIQGGVPSEAFR